MKSLPSGSESSRYRLRIAIKFWVQLRRPPFPRDSVLGPIEISQLRTARHERLRGQIVHRFRAHSTGKHAALSYKVSSQTTNPTNERERPRPNTPMDVEGLSAQIEQLHSLSYGWALSCCGRDPAEAADVLQTVYLKILNGRAQCDGRASFKTWLFAVIRLTAAEERRRRWLRMTRLGDYLRERSHSETAADHAAGRAEPGFMAHVEKALTDLAPRQREVLHLVFYQELTIEEAGKVMGVSLGSARTHYERGKQRLRQRINESGILHEYEQQGQRAPGAV